MRWEVVDDNPGHWDAPHISQELQRIISEQVLGISVGPSTGAQVFDCVYRALADIPGVDRRGISFRSWWCQGGEVTIEPDNLYTGLLLVGHVCPEELLSVARPEGEVAFPEGVYCFRDGSFYFRPHRTPEMIDFTINVPQDMVTVDIDSRIVQALGDVLGGAKVEDPTWGDLLRELMLDLLLWDIRCIKYDIRQLWSKLHHV